MPQWVYEIRRKHYVFWEISRLARGLPKTFTYSTWDPKAVSQLIFVIKMCLANDVPCWFTRPHDLRKTKPARRAFRFAIKSVTRTSPAKKRLAWKRRLPHLGGQLDCSILSQQGQEIRFGQLPQIETSLSAWLCQSILVLRVNENRIRRYLQKRVILTQVRCVVQLRTGKARGWRKCQPRLANSKFQLAGGRAGQWGKSFGFDGEMKEEMKGGRK